MEQTSRIQGIEELEEELNDLTTSLYLLECEVLNLPRKEEFKKLVYANEKVQDGMTSMLVKYMDFISKQIRNIHEKIGDMNKEET